MSLKFTDNRLWLKGIGCAYLRDPSTGDVVYYSNKFTTGQITPSSDAGEITAGPGATLATMLPTNARVAVNFTAADFDLFVKGASVGATMETGAPVPVCETVVAAGAELTIAKTMGTPVSPVGYSSPICYVQEVDAPSLVENDGTAYSISAAGVISGFTATSGKTYKVNYFVTRANAKMATITGSMNGQVLHFTSEHDIYVNVDPTTKKGNFWGKLYVVIPMLKLMTDGAAIDGDQTSNTTTGIVGQALMYDDEVVTADCTGCGSAASPLAYYIVVPCDATSDINGLVVLGGVINVNTDTTTTINEYRLVVGKNLVEPDPAKMTYALDAGAPTGTSVSGNTLTTGSTAGDTELTGTYTDGTLTLSCVANLSITEPTP